MWQYNPTELQHHGVLGMKWGRRRGGSASTSVSKPTTNYSKVSVKKQAATSAKIKVAEAKIKKKEAAKDWDSAYNDLASPIRNWGPSGNAVRSKASETARRSGQADKNYKQAKKDYKQAKKDYNKERQLPNENYKSSKLDKALMGDGGQAQINRMLNTNKNMTVSQARKTTAIEAGVNTAAALLVIYGSYKLRS
ncbi:hypothetical protein [Bacteroides sp.]|uniref:DUF7211 domain-containing protein n=1 Tax=Bacteroides sp. TaxID=29523 RepID=UPI00260D03E1|nr:hypothetical protein [Bacteroides sp.]MDD3040072.1 hypothetical protein [Bacteroides sp.]